MIKIRRRKGMRIATPFFETLDDVLNEYSKDEVLKMVNEFRSRQQAESYQRKYDLTCWLCNDLVWAVLDGWPVCSTHYTQATQGGVFVRQMLAVDK